MSKPIYLDHHATTPVDRRVLDVMWPFFADHFGNPSSVAHVYGWDAESAVARARLQLARLLGCRPFEVIFTSSATESNNTVLLGVTEALRSKGRHIVTTAYEHKSVLAPCGLLEKQGFEVTYLRPGRDGQISISEFEKSLRPDTVLASVIWANNESGTVLDIADWARVAKTKGVLFHSDATQAAQYLDIDVTRAPVDFLTLSGHKMYGPKGVGALYVRSEPERVPFSPLLLGGGQESGLRGGTLNVPGIVGMGLAAELALTEREANREHVLHLRNRLLQRLQKGIPGFVLHGGLEKRLPNNLNFHVDGVDGSRFIDRVTSSLAVSTGSACLGGASSGSHVLAALGYGATEMASSIRIGLGKMNTEQDVDQAAEVIIAATQSN